MKFLAEVGLHFSGDLGIELPPRIGTPRCQRDDEEADDADNEKKHDTQRKTTENE